MRKDLNPLLGLHRSALVSLMQKSASDTPQDNHFQYLLSAFTKKHVGEWLKEYWKYRIGRKHPFQTWINHSGVFTIPNSCKMSVAGDWGTGTDEAFEVGRRILESQPDYTIHLGDVYYVGSELEVMENFLGNAEGNKFSPCTWPRGRTGSLALSGNHEMYARGFGYFDSLLPTMNVNGVQQEASYFCLENDHWRILGLDTGYNSVGLPGIEQVIQPSCELTKEQIDWVGGLKLSDSKGLILMTHHQYYSAFESAYRKAAQQLSQFIHKPVLWIWGHEHRMSIYGLYGQDSIQAYGRCIGHGGMPVELKPIKHKEVPLEFYDQRIYPSVENIKVGYNGHANLIFSGEKLQIDYVDLTGTVVYSESFKSDLNRFAKGGM